jgi:RNA polymerase sigma-70 factor (ECF subfamily)
VTEIDEFTLEQARRGSKKAFRSLYRHYSPFVWRLCFRSSNGDTLRAEEITQNTFVKIHRYLPDFSGNSALSTWIYTVTFNCVNEYFAKLTKYNNRNVLLDEESVGSASDYLPYENRQLVSQILKDLSEKERFLLTAREVDGLSYEELAVITGEPEGTLRTRLSRLKSDIRKRIEQTEEGV